MKSEQRVYRQLRSAAPTLMKLYIPTLILLVGFVLLKIFRGVKTSDMMRDPAQITGSNPFLGLLSNLGILFWCSSAAICLFCSAVLRKNQKDRNYASFFLLSGLITSFLLIDDLFMFHDFVMPVCLHIHEVFVYIFYAVLISTWLFVFRRTILGTNWSILLLALVFFAVSMLIDFIPGKLLGRWLFEDGSKFLGIVTWMYYFTQTCFQRLDLVLNDIVNLERD